MLKQRQHTSIQGNMGLGIAISYFTLQGCIVSIPLNDIQDYDLIADFGDGRLKKIQVKTTRFMERGKYKVDIKSRTKSFQENNSDYLFVVDGRNTKYLIPKAAISARNAISLGGAYASFIVC